VWRSGSKSAQPSAAAPAGRLVYVNLRENRCPPAAAVCPGPPGDYTLAAAAAARGTSPLWVPPWVGGVAAVDLVGDPTPLLRKLAHWYGPRGLLAAAEAATLEDGRTATGEAERF
jgi:hypothetical protein